MCNVIDCKLLNKLISYVTLSFIMHDSTAMHRQINVNKYYLEHERDTGLIPKSVHGNLLFMYIFHQF